MNKKLLVVLISTLITIPTNSYAAKNSSLKNNTVQPISVAILDTALDNTLPEIRSRVIHEVCILEWDSCPNGRSFMEGRNAAFLPPTMINRNGFDHGTQMVSAAIQANPNINIVFIRIIGQSINGDRQVTSEKTIFMALDWIIQNRDRFNIQSVAMSQGHHNLLPFADYCPKTPITESKIKTLFDLGVPVFFASGNNSNPVRIDWPACIPLSISVGAATRNGIELYSNYDRNLLDFHANSRARIATAGGRIVNASGTSISAQTAAAAWIAIKSSRPTLSYSQIYDILQKTSRDVRGRQGSGKIIDISAALNG